MNRVERGLDSVSQETVELQPVEREAISVCDIRLKSFLWAAPDMASTVLDPELDADIKFEMIEAIEEHYLEMKRRMEYMLWSTQILKQSEDVNTQKLGEYFSESSTNIRYIVQKLDELIPKLYDFVASGKDGSVDSPEVNVIRSLDSELKRFCNELKPLGQIVMTNPAYRAYRDSTTEVDRRAGLTKTPKLVVASDLKSTPRGERNRRAAEGVELSTSDFELIKSVDVKMTARLSSVDALGSAFIVAGQKVDEVPDGPERVQRRLEQERAYLVEQVEAMTSSLPGLQRSTSEHVRELASAIEQSIQLVSEFMQFQERALTVMQEAIAAGDYSDATTNELHGIQDESLEFARTRFSAVGEAIAKNKAYQKYRSGVSEREREVDIPLEEDTKDQAAK